MYPLVEASYGRCEQWCFFARRVVWLQENKVYPLVKSDVGLSRLEELLCCSSPGPSTNRIK